MPVCPLALSGLGYSAIRKLPNTPQGEILVALGDPATRAIVELLLDVDSSTPGDIAAHVQKRFTIVQSSVSDRITELSRLRVIERRQDGTVCLTDPAETERIIQAARRLVGNVFGEISRVAKSEHALRARRSGRRDRAPDLGPAARDDRDALPPERSDSVDDVAARVDSEHSAANDPLQAPDATLGRREPRTRPTGWPAVVWVSHHDRSRPHDLIDNPARYVAAPARLLILNADWPGFGELISACAAVYADRFGVEFLRWTIDREMRSHLENAVADAIIAAEAAPGRERKLDEGPLRSIIEDAMPSIESQIKQALHEALERPAAPPTNPT